MRHDKYELVRYGLKRYNLIEDGPSLEDRQCELDWDKGNCYNCMATHICTKRVRFFHTFTVCSDTHADNVFHFRIHSQELSMKLLKLPTQKPKQ